MHAAPAIVALCLASACAQPRFNGSDQDTLPGCRVARECGWGGDGTLVVPIAFVATAVAVPVVLHLLYGRRTATGAHP